MSWVKSVARSDDVFDEDVDELSVQNREWSCNMQKRVKDGYRDGTDAGKEASLQHGFNLGYREGVVQMKAIGQLKGIISALQYWCQSQPTLSSLPIKQLLQRVEKHEENLFEAMRQSQEMLPPSVSEVAGDMEDMGVDQNEDGASGCCHGDSECCKEDLQRDGGQNKGTSDSLFGIPTKTLFSNTESLEQLLHSCMELATEMGLPEELKLNIQQLRHA